MERRVIEEGLELEVRENEPVKMRGYGIVFNKWSVDLGNFIEMIEPDAVRDIDFTDVVSLFNHNDDNILGRVPNTMSVEVDSMGVRYIVELPNSPNGQNVRVAIQRKDVKGSSFAFDIDTDEWFKRADGVWERRIKKFKRIYDLSPVVFPAYPDTTVAMRSLTEVLKKDGSKRKIYYFRKEAELLKIK